MRNIVLSLLFVSVSLCFISCCYEIDGGQEDNNLIFENNAAIKAIKIYNDFLNGKLDAEGININYITIPKGEPDKRYSTIYTFFDSNGDKMPELHIKSLRYYYVFTVTDNKLKIWADLSPNHCLPLKDGAFMRWKCGSAPMSDMYNYEIRGFSGDIIFRVNFGKYDENKNGVYDENDYYVFEGTEISEEIWNGLTRKYLYVNEYGNEDICNKIDNWITIYD